eukprot:4196877-Alexandrium_andersonii.AAC.1
MPHHWDARLPEDSAAGAKLLADAVAALDPSDASLRAVARRVAAHGTAALQHAALARVWDPSALSPAPAEGHVLVPLDRDGKRRVCVDET